MFSTECKPKLNLFVCCWFVVQPGLYGEEAGKQRNWLDLRLQRQMGKRWHKSTYFTSCFLVKDRRLKMIGWSTVVDYLTIKQQALLFIYPLPSVWNNTPIRQVSPNFRSLQIAVKHLHVSVSSEFICAVGFLPFCHHRPFARQIQAFVLDYCARYKCMHVRM